MTGKRGRPRHADVNAAKGAAWAAPPKEEPASLPEKSEEDLRAAVRSHLPAAISTAARIASDVNQRPADQLAAAKLLMDFGLSRPQPPANARADLEHLRELAAFLRGDKPDSP